MMPSLVSNMHAQWLRQELLANNLANASTAGFKQDDLMLFTPSSPAGASPSGTHILAQWTDFSQSSIRDTGRELDIAVDGSGFLAVQTPRGVRYTRSGALAVSRDGYLVTASGYQVLGEGGPISVRSSRPSITEKGEVVDDGQTVDTVRVVDFAKPYRLTKEGDGLFAPADAAVAPGRAQDHQLVGGALEDSNVNTVRTMVQMIEMLRGFESAQRAIQAVDEADRYAANDMGRV
jgi:flagellar basal-body rod protein FlgF